ncbi:MAG: PHB depolymerase family esterase [Bacteroidia bacterium]
MTLYNLLIASLLFLAPFGEMNMNASNPQREPAAQAPLEFLIRAPKQRSGPAPLLLLLHGYGSNAQDIFPLAQQVPDEWIVVAASGPQMQGEGRHAWYDVQLVDGKIRIHAPGADHSRKLVLDLIAHLKTAYSVDARRVVVAGFSQGANLAQSVALSSPETVSAFGVFSGRWVEELRSSIAPQVSNKTTKGFIAHGSRDHMLPMHHAQENIAQLQAMGLRVTFVEDTTPHIISQKQFKAFTSWLNQD